MSSVGSNPTGSTNMGMWRKWQTRRVQGAFSVGSNPTMPTIKGAMFETVNKFHR